MSSYQDRKRAAMQRDRECRDSPSASADSENPDTLSGEVSGSEETEANGLLKKAPRSKRPARKRTPVQREHDRHDADGYEPQTPEQRTAMDEVSQPAPAEPEADEPEDDAQEEPRRRPGRKPAGLHDAPRVTNPKDPAEGWYVCCAEPFYVGYGWKKRPQCNRCGEDSRQATRGEVFA